MLRIIALAGLSAPTAAAIALLLAVPLAKPARAQGGIGNIFSDPVPRPPANIPRGNQPPPDEEEEVPMLPQGRVLPAPNRPYPGQTSNMPGPVQSQPLAPPPGVTALPQNVPPPVAVHPPQPGGPQNAAMPPGVNPTLPGLPPGQRQPRGTPQAPASLQPGDEIVQEPPAEKIINKKASFSGLDKITGRVISFDEDIGETVQFGALRVKTDACYTRPATEAANTDAFVEVDEITLQGEVKRIFSGWMFAASPGLHAVEHPIYDVWLTDCKGPETTLVTAAPEAKPAPAPAPPAAQRRAAPRAAPRPQPPPQRQVREAPPPPPPPPPPPEQRPGGLFGIFR